VTAKEELLERAPRWTEHEAEIALRAVEHERQAQEDVAEEWGDLSAFRAALTEADEDEDEDQPAPSAGG
jgi:hypothetical protein